MKQLILIALVLSASWSFGQEAVKKVQEISPSTANAAPKEPEKPKELKQFSPEDKDELRGAEVDTLQLTIQYQNLSLQATQVKSQLDVAQAIQQRIWRRMILKYGIDEKKETLCDGPSGPPICKDVKPHDLVRKANP